MEITKEDFEAYEAVRESGVTNMCAITTVSELRGLDKVTIREIMNGSSLLSEQYSGEE